MTLDEKIINESKCVAIFKDLAESHHAKGEIQAQNRCLKLLKDSKQLVDWLIELRKYRFEISECKAILDNPTPDVTENDRKRAMYVLQTFPDVRGEQYEN